MHRRDFVKAASLAAGSGAMAAPADTGWPVYAGDQAATRFSAARQITPANVANLEVAWVHRSAPEGSRYRGSLECTPVVVGDIMYISGAGLTIQALHAATGKLLWSYAPLGTASGRRASGVCRGVTYWKDGSRERIFAPIQNRIWCVDAKTGKPVESFGESGSIDVEKDIDRDMTGLSLGSTTPGVICRDVLVITSRTEEGPRPAAPGHIRAYDLRTGKRRWIFHTIPHPGEFGYETWSPDSWKTAGGANNWGGMSVDDKRGLVFVSTGSPAFDFFGGDRVGANLFGNCVICLDAATGKRVWHFQTVHHDLWDYDIPCAPTLVTVTHKGRKVDAVAQVSKTGWVYLFERASGQPLYPIEERKVPQSDVPGEKTYPTQPFPTAPPPFSRQGVNREDITNISPEARKYVEEQLREARFGPMFTPPAMVETIVLPGYHGGALWGGASFDPASERLYLNHNEIPWSTSLKAPPQGAKYRYDFNGYTRNNDANGYTAIRPPWGLMSAIDLKNAKIVWQVPHGEFKKLTARGVPRTGTYIRGGCVATSGGVIFNGGTLDSTFRAYEAKTGKVLWEFYLGGGAFATPSTYTVDGRQFVAVPVSDDLNPEEPAQEGPYRMGDFVAFALPAR